MGTVVAVVLWGSAWLAAVDGFRQPQSAWIAADRDRGFWLTFLICLGPLFLIPYLLAVRPRFVDDASTADEFKR